MYCPSCGKTNSVDQKFCRSCGLSLEKVLQSLAEQRPTVDFDKSLQERRQRVERWATILGGTGLFLFVLTVIWAIIYKIIIVKGDVAEGVGFLVFLIGIVVFALLMLYRESLAKASKRPVSEPVLPRAEDTANLLGEPSFEPIPSVTERTTELLPVEKKDTRK